MSPTAPQKIQKLQGSCDICRRQKVRCDSAAMPGNRCSRCIAFGSDCTHDLLQSAKEKKKRRKPLQTSSEMEAGRILVNRVLLGTYKPPEDHEALVQLLLQVSRYARSLERHPSGTASRTSSNSDGQKEDADAEAEISIHSETLEPKGDRADHQYFGKIASMVFIGAAIEARKKDAIVLRGPRFKRTAFWSKLPWEASESPRSEPPVSQTFPADDLLRDLVNLYFTELHTFSFVLHRPTFEMALADGLHLSDHRFGSIVLAVCALASKGSSDRRVLLPGEGELSAGWEWFRQIPRPFSGTQTTASIYDLQLCCLYIAFQKLGANLEPCWLLSGVGILHAQIIGAHRRQNKDAPWTVEAELATRICYYLCIFDTLFSSCFDRPRVGTALERELDLPTVCGEDYWESRTFQQPSGQPSLAAYNIAYIKLMGIYSSFGRAGLNPNFPQDAASMVQIDSRLDQWATEIPEHLLWNPYKEDDAFFAQSAALYTQYYHREHLKPGTHWALLYIRFAVQILLHRSLLQSASNEPRPPSAFRSLAICANAARSTAHVTDVRSHRGIFDPTHNLKAVFDAAVVLVLNISGGARSGLSIDTDRELVAVYQCMGFLRRSENRAQYAGQFYDLLCELLHASELPLPESSAPQLQVPIIQDSQEGNLWPDHLLSLPMGGVDLGSLPVYDSREMNTRLAENGGAFVEPHISRPGDAAVDWVNGETPGQAGAFANFNDVEMDTYMSQWIPYWSGASTLVQAMGDTSPR
ncbi:hypothetical protein C8R43DRAFT_1203013 [Mycena crocata]|nr:hypothetical protein C8R43DRAFT_1203013 [Mycena crocata]